MTPFRRVPEPSIIVLTTDIGSTAGKRRTFTGAIGAVPTEVVPDTVAQRTGLPDINRVAFRVEVQIHSRLLGQPGDLILEFVDGHTLLCRGS